MQHVSTVALSKKVTKARLHYKKQGPKAIQSLGLGLDYTKTNVLDPATL